MESGELKEGLGAGLFDEREKSALGPANQPRETVIKGLTWSVRVAKPQHPNLAPVLLWQAPTRRLDGTEKGGPACQGCHQKPVLGRKGVHESMWGELEARTCGRHQRTEQIIESNNARARSFVLIRGRQHIVFISWPSNQKSMPSDYLL